jgi:hypothetical protein
LCAREADETFQDIERGATTAGGSLDQHLESTITRDCLIDARTAFLQLLWLMQK